MRCMSCMNTMITKDGPIFAPWYMACSSSTRPAHYGTELGHFETSIIHFPTSESERCKRTSEQTSEWPSTYLPILGCSAPLCSECDAPSVLTSDKSCSLDDVLQLLRLLYVISRHDQRLHDSETEDANLQVTQLARF